MKRIFAGLDVGSSAVKAVLIDEIGTHIGSETVPTGLNFAGSAKTAYDAALATAGVVAKDVVAVASCGYGRRNVDFANTSRTEIACIAKAVHLHFKDRVTVLDIGGRDIKLVHVSPSGVPEDFKMNTQCAASTGAFLEDIAGRMKIPLSSLNDLASSAVAPTPISAHCTVFAAGEVIAAARSGERVENIVLGIYHSMVKRIIEMITTEGNIVISGGVVAHNPIVLRLATEALKRPVSTPPNPQLTGALGAALFARDSAKAEQETFK